MIQKVSMVSLLLVGALITGCAAPMGANVAAKRNYVRNMRDAALAQLYFFDPDLRSKVAEAAGIAVFDSLNLHLLVLATSRGYGIAVDNATGKETYMKLIRVGARTGLALGLAGAGAQPSGIEGGARAQTGMGTATGGGLASQGMGMRVYEITQNGVVLQAMITGTIYVKDTELN